MNKHTDLPFSELRQTLGSPPSPSTISNPNEAAFPPKLAMAMLSGLHESNNNNAPFIPNKTKELQSDYYLRFWRWPEIDELRDFGTEMDATAARVAISQWNAELQSCLFYFHNMHFYQWIFFYLDPLIF